MAAWEGGRGRRKQRKGKGERRKEEEEEEGGSGRQRSISRDGPRHLEHHSTIKRMGNVFCPKKKSSPRRYRSPSTECYTRGEDKTDVHAACT